MPKLSIKDVEHIAKLSRLELSDAEKCKFAGQLSSVLEYVELLKEVDTEGIEATAQVTGMASVVVADKTRLEENLGYSDISSNAPEFKSGNFIVPGIFV